MTCSTPSTPIGRRPTDRQLDVLRAIHRSIETTGRPPTVREIAIAIGVSPRSIKGISQHLEALEARGILAREGDKARAIRILPAGLRLLPGGAERAVLDELRARLEAAQAKHGPRFRGGLGMGSVPAETVERLRARNDAAQAEGRETCFGVLSEEVAEAGAETDLARVRDELLDIATVCLKGIHQIDAEQAGRGR